MNPVLRNISTPQLVAGAATTVAFAIAVIAHETFRRFALVHAMPFGESTELIPYAGLAAALLFCLASLNWQVSAYRHVRDTDGDSFSNSMLLAMGAPTVLASLLRMIGSRYTEVKAPFEAGWVAREHYDALLHLSTAYFIACIAVLASTAVVWVWAVMRFRKHEPGSV